MKKLLVHNTSGKLEAALASRLPSGWQTRAMAAHDPWSIDPKADAVFLTHSVAGAGRRATVAMPDGWPRRVALVQLASAGLQGYPSWLFAAPIVASGRGTSALPIAEYVLTAMLAHEKRIEQLWLEGRWCSQAGRLARTECPARPRRLNAARASSPQTAHLEPHRTLHPAGAQTTHRQSQNFPKRRSPPAPRYRHRRRNRRKMGLRQQSLPSNGNTRMGWVVESVVRLARGLHPRRTTRFDDRFSG